ncbi:MAG: C25 family cysteine peptidase [Planctomycetota bacterium]
MGALYRLLPVVMWALCVCASAAEIRFTVTTDPGEVSQVRHGEYLLLGLPGAPPRAAIGAPAIPIKRVQVVVPAGAQITGVRCSGAETVLATDVLVLPRQPSHALDAEAPPFVAPDAAVYGTDAPLPTRRVETGSEATVRARRLLTLRVAPLRYNPVAQELTLCERLEVCLSYDDGFAVQSDGGIRPHSAIDARMRGVVANPEALDAATVQESATPAATIDYLIITNAELAESFQDLADRRAVTHGYTSAVLTVEDIETDYSGADTQAKIRACIKAYVQDSETSMVVLGGDEAVVPVRRCYCEIDLFGTGLVGVSDLPADLYYSELDGDWNADGDDEWGEIDDDVDNFGWDVVVGRIPVRTPQNVADYIAKLAHLEDDEPNGLNDRFLMAGSPLTMGDDLEEGDTGLEMDRDVHEWDGLPSLYDAGRLRQDDEFWSRRIAYDFLADVYSPGTIAGLFSTVSSWDTSTPGDYGVSADEMIDRFSEDWGLCFWFSHGTAYCLYTENADEGGYTSFDIFEGHVDALAGHTAIFVTPACQAGRFDWSGHEERDPCLSEALLRHPGGGAVVYHGSARNGYGGDLDVYGGESGHFAGGFMRELATSVDGQVGMAHAVSKSALADACQEHGYYRALMFTINLQGDPAYRLPPAGDDPERVVQFTVAEGTEPVETAVIATQDGSTLYEDSATTHPIAGVDPTVDLEIAPAPVPASNN